MQITICGPLQCGPSWEALQEMIRTMIGEGSLTRIARRDGSCCYTDPGTYDLTFRKADTAIAIVLDVRAYPAGTYRASEPKRLIALLQRGIAQLADGIMTPAEYRDYVSAAVKDKDNGTHV